MTAVAQTLSAAADNGWTNNTFLKALAHLGSSIACLFHQEIRSISVETSSLAAMYMGISIFNPSIVMIDSGSGSSAGRESVNHFTRSKASVVNFDWRSRCFICCELCN